MIFALILSAALSRDYFVTEHWITVTETAPGTWTDGVDTWRGEPGCKSAGELYTGNPSCVVVGAPAMATIELQIQ